MSVDKGILSYVTFTMLPENNAIMYEKIRYIANECIYKFNKNNQDCGFFCIYYVAVLHHCKLTETISLFCRPAHGVESVQSVGKLRKRQS